MCFNIEPEWKTCEPSKEDYEAWEREQLIKQNKQYREALELLLEAKRMKDHIGKCGIYEELKNKGWKAAKEALEIKE